MAYLRECDVENGLIRGNWMGTFHPAWNAGTADDEDNFTLDALLLKALSKRLSRASPEFLEFFRQFPGNDKLAVWAKR